MKIPRIAVKPFSSDRFEVIEDYNIVVNILDYKPKAVVSEVIVDIKKGFKTNGADIPRLLWPIYPPFKSEYLSAVIVHDYLCNIANEYLEEKKYIESKYHYENADIVFKIVLKELNVRPITIFIFYNACDIFHKIKIFIKSFLKR